MCFAGTCNTSPAEDLVEIVTGRCLHITHTTSCRYPLVPLAEFLEYLFVIGLPLSRLIGTPLPGQIMILFDGVHGLQWLFDRESPLSIGLGAGVPPSSQFGGSST
jgi:hypothetical protein